MPGLEVGRVAEVLVEVAVGPGKRGSGYLVGPGAVLTAAHVVAGAVRVRVRFQAHRPEERVVTAEVAFAHAEADVAVLALSDRSDEVANATYGRVGEHDAVLRCSAMGFPVFKLRDSPTALDGGPYRDSEHVHGTCSVLSNRKEGTLDLRVPPPDGSWDGMSGAAVFSGDRIVGVVAAHHLDDGPGRLAVSRADRWARRIPEEELALLEALLGRPLAPERLPDVLPPSGLGRIKDGYEALLRDIAPVQLMGRRDELRELVEFCAGPEPYRWIQGRPWAGKTALVSSFALRPPRGVVPVWFFITSRLAGQSDSTAYTEALVHQLAALVGREPSAHASPAVRDVERRALLTEAAERVAEDGGTLLLVVDGLDEDHSARTPGAPGPSIASLLPDRLPAGLRVLVTSRPNPDLPLDVAHGHPLRRCAVKTLGSTGAVTDLEHEARFELSRALAGDDLEKEIVGLLAAARGSLRTEDLRELSGRKLYEVGQRVNGVFGRILRVRGDSAREFADRGYLFAHETLFAAAVEMLGPDVGPYRERVHAWAEGYRERGWPEGTPPYLLQQYGRMAAGSGSVGRAVALVTDGRWLDRVHGVTGSDAAALAQIEAVRQALGPEGTADLCGLAALAAAQDLLALRYGSLPAKVPAVLVRLGQPVRAEGLARSIAVPLERARALAGVARALADLDEERAADMAREAVQLAERHADDAPRFGEKGEVPREVLRVAAAALAAVGQVTEAVGLAERVAEREEYSPALIPREHDLFMKTEIVWILTGVAMAARSHDPRRAADVLDAALGKTLQIQAPEWRVLPLVEVARACAEVDAGKAAKLWDMVEECAALEAPDRIVLLAVTASEIHGERPERARDFAMSAYALLGSMGDPQEPSVTVLPRRVLAVVDALVTCGLMREAETVADTFRDTVRTAGHGEVAKGYLRAGDTERAWQFLQDASRVLHLDISSFMACELAAGGHFDEAERCAARISDPRTAAHALSVMAEHAVDHDPARAAALVAQAIATAGSKPEACWQGGQLVALSDALMMCDERNAAERLTHAIDMPADRTLALAATAVRLHASDPVGAARLAEAAADICEGEAAEVTTAALEATVEALACTGAGGRVDGLLDRVGSVPRRAQLILRAACCEQSMTHSDARADAMERQVRAGSDFGVRVTDLAELVVAFARTAPERVDGLLEALGSGDAVDEYLMSTESAVLAMLLLAEKDPERSRWLMREVDDRLRPSEDGFEAVDSTPYMLGALVHVAHAEYEAADALASRVRWPEDVAELRTAMAVTMAGLSTWPSARTGRHGLFPGLLPLTLQCIELTVRRPPADAERIAKARAQLHQVLTTENWHYALPVLARLAPDAVRRVRDVVFAHLGLGVSDPPPRPAPA